MEAWSTASPRMAGFGWNVLAIILIMRILGTSAFSFSPVTTGRSSAFVTRPTTTTIPLLPFVRQGSCHHDQLLLQHQSRRQRRRRSLFQMSSSSYPDAEDGEALQMLFERRCSSDGLMSLESLKDVPAIAEMLEEEDLLLTELESIWTAAPKFPTDESKIDVDSFIQIYRDIDDLFEDDDDEEEGSVPDASGDGEEGEAEKKIETTKVASSTASSAPLDELSEQEKEDEQDMESVFARICNDQNLVTKEMLEQWDEVQQLFGEGLLSQAEFENIWKDTPKAPGSTDLSSLDVEGFLSFNVALDDLFVFDEEDEQEREEPAVDSEYNDDTADLTEASSPADTPVVTRNPGMLISGEGMSPSELFQALANEDNLVGRPEMKCWAELKDMIFSGDLLSDEFEAIYMKYAKDDKLDEAGFVAVFNDVDDLFEEVDDGDEDETESADDATVQISFSDPGRSKASLLSFIEVLNGDTERLPCGLESLESEQDQIEKIVEVLESAPSNVVRQKDDGIDLDDVLGQWELLYCSSDAVMFNQGLSGLGKSIPNAKFAGLTQTLSTSKFTSDVEYKERIEVNPAAASFDVTVTGGWDLRQLKSVFTGQPSTVLTIEPDMIEYGFTSMKADHWKTLGPMIVLDVTYLDEDLRIMRGSTATDSIFVFKRIP